MSAPIFIFVCYPCLSFPFPSHPHFLLLIFVTTVKTRDVLIQDETFHNIPSLCILLTVKSTNTFYTVKAKNVKLRN